MLSMFYMFLLALWPTVNYLNNNFSKFNNFKDIYIIALISLITSYVIGKIIQKYSKEGIERFLLAFFVSIVLFFNYGYFVDSLGILANSILKASYIWLFLSGLLVYGAWKLSKPVEVQQASKFLIIIVMIVPLLQIGYSHFIDSAQKIIYNIDNDLTFTFMNKPNVYYILTDAYARQDTLKEVANFDNEPFLRELEEKGFLVSRRAISNYHFTGASLSATMNMNYHQYEKDGSLKYNQMHEALRGNNQVRRIFQNNNYKIINIPAHYHQMSCNGYENKCIRERSYEVYESYFSQTPIRFLKIPIIYVDFKNIKDASNFFPGEPKFIFAHLAQIHDAIYDNSGNLQSQLHPAFSNALEAQRYISSIKIMNNKLLDLVKYLRKHDPNAIIILQADHGPTFTGNLKPKNSEYWLKNTQDIRLQNKNDFRYTFGIFSAIYIPPSKLSDKVIKSYLKASPTLINIFRYLFAYLSNEVPQPLEDVAHFLYFDDNAGVYKEDNISDYIN